MSMNAKTALFTAILMSYLVVAPSAGWKLSAAEPSQPEAERSFRIIQDGRAMAMIVIPVSADDWTRKAASWLQNYVERITGGKLPIASENEPTSGPRISVGYTQLAAQAKVVRDNWKWDTACMVVKGDVLFLIGRDETPRAIAQKQDVGLGKREVGIDYERQFGAHLGAKGTCKAVVAFLEEFCGVRWFLPVPDGEYVPKRTAIATPLDLDRTIEPVFAYSHGRYLYGVGTPASFANNFRTAIKLRSYGGHSYYSWLPAEKYFKDHPDYFALVNGKRIAEGNHLCSSNPEVRNILIREIRKEFDAGYDWVQLGQEDNYTRCQCPSCEALDNYRDEMPPDWYEMYDQVGFERLATHPCERLLLLHKAIADACRQSHPDKTVQLLVYRQTLVPSRKFDSFGKNVVGEMCNINPQALLPWKGRAPAFTGYLYWFDITLGMGMGLHTTPQQAAARIRYLRDWNFVGIYQIPETNWGLQGPIYWTIARTMGNPDLDPDKLVREYCRGVFEDAAPAMLEFFKRLYARDVEALERSSAADKHLFYYPPSLVVELEALLARAESQAKTERGRNWVRLTREHFNYIKRVSFLLAAYQAYQASPSEGNRGELLQRREDFEAFRKHIVELDDAYTTRWFPGHGEFANFLTSKAQNVYYTPWRERREQVKREGYAGTMIGFNGASAIREPFAVQ